MANRYRVHAVRERDGVVLVEQGFYVVEKLPGGDVRKGDWVEYTSDGRVRTVYQN